MNGTELRIIICGTVICVNKNSWQCNSFHGYYLSPLEMCVHWEILLGGASFVSFAGQHTFCWQNCDNQAGIYKHKCLYLSHRAHIGWIFVFHWRKKHEHLWKNKTSQCSFVSWGHHPALTTNIFTSIWPIEDRQEMWWPAKHSTECPA